MSGASTQMNQRCQDGWGLAQLFLAVTLVCTALSLPSDALADPDAAKIADSMAFAQQVLNLPCHVPGGEAVADLPGVEEARLLSDNYFLSAQRTVAKARDAVNQIVSSDNAQRLSDQRRNRVNERLNATAGLAGALATESMANWLLSQGYLLTKLSTIYTPPSDPDPTVPFLASVNRFSQFANDIKSWPNAERGLVALAQRQTTCIAEVRAALITANEASIREGVSQAKSILDVNRVVSSYWLAEVSSPLSLSLRNAANSRIHELTPKRVEVARVDPNIELNRQLQIASRYIQAVRSGDVAMAASFYSDDVELRVPSNAGPSHYGKAAVVQQLRNSQGSSGEISAPQISGGRIVAPGRTFRSGRWHRISMTFTFQNDKIRSMAVSTN